MSTMDRTPGMHPAGSPSGGSEAAEHRRRFARYDEVAGLSAHEIMALLDPDLSLGRLRDVILAMEEDRRSRMFWDAASPSATESPGDVAGYEEAPVSPGESGCIYGLTELSGAIKWFDASKGYGFITPDNGLPDVLLHVDCLRSSGFQTAFEGARVVADCLRRSKGFQALRISSMDDSTAIHPSSLPLRAHSFARAESGWEDATVKWFNRIRGFGFLSRSIDGRDIFVHMETLRRFGMAELRRGQLVEVRWGHGSKGMTAAEIRPKPTPAGWPHLL